MAANKRLYRYDVLRTIACVSIVVYHFDVESARNTPPQRLLTCLAGPSHFST